MTAEVFVDVFASGGGAHVFFEGFVDALKLSGFFSEFCLDIPGSEDVFEVDPVFLDDEPVIDDEHGVVDEFLKVLGLGALSFEVAVAEDGAKISKEFVEFSVEIFDVVEDEGVFVAGVVRFVLLCGELQLHPARLVFFDLLFEDLFLFGESGDFDDFVLVHV